MSSKIVAEISTRHSIVVLKDFKILLIYNHHYEMINLKLPMMRGPQSVRFTKKRYWVMSDLYIPGVLISP